MFIRQLNRIMLSVSIVLFSFIVTGCATEPYTPPPAPKIAINTIPAGADISIKGNYIGQSPLIIDAPANFTGSEPIKIEARLEGYEAKEVALGDYHPPQDEVLTRMQETSFMIQEVPAGVKTIPAYYTYPNAINIKLYPKK